MTMQSMMLKKKKQFTKIKCIYLGFKAVQLLESVARLTASARNPKGYDLSKDVGVCNCVFPHFGRRYQNFTR